MSPSTLVAGSLRERVQSVLDEIRPFVQGDAGDVELVGIENGVVKVKMTGACETCPSSSMTLREGILKRLREEVPEIDHVVAVNLAF